jgi:hypothetical protein
MNGPDGLGMSGGADGAPDASGGMDLDSLLGGTSPQGETTPGLQDGLQGQGDSFSGGSEPYKFAGRTWKGGQKEAEAAWNKIYGGYSERQGLVNALKGADAETLAVLARDPKVAQILAKFGISAAEVEAQGLMDRRQGGEQQMSHEDMQREIKLERHQNRILREEWAFERKMGRPVSEREQQAVYKQLERSEDLSYEEAYFLAHRQQILKAQAQQRAASGTAAPGLAQEGGRPKPPPRSMPGSAVPGKKSMADMSEQEWKNNLRESGLIKEMLSKGR